MSIRSFRRAHARRVAGQHRRLTAARRRALVAGATVSASAAFAAGAQAATYTVTTNGDDATPAACDPSGNCATLRDAINAANGDTSADTIVFADTVTSPITLAYGPLTISGSGGLTISGPGQSDLTISGDGSSQIFSITADTGTPVSISGLTLDDAVASDSGGAIENDSATLSLSNDAITGSTAQDGSGGGVQSDGPLTISGSTITGNTATDGSGGGVSEGKYSSLSVTNSVITGNQTTSGGDPFSGQGGGIYAIDSSLSVTGSTVSGNTTVDDGGGIESKYFPFEDGPASRPAAVAPSSSSNGVQISQTTVSGNHAADGGGVAIDGDPSGSPVTISTSTLSGNTASAPSSSSGSFGGGLFVGGPVGGPFDLIDSTISGNTADHGGGVALGDGNEAVLGSGTGSTPSLGFDNSTIDANTANTDGGGIYLSAYSSSSTEESPTAALNSTIVAGDTASGTAQDLFRPSSSTSGGFNAAYDLIQQPGNAPLLTSNSVITGVDPQLGPLQNNGGPTETMLPGPNSPVLDQGKAAAGLTTDQRGDPRTVNLGKTRPPGGDGTDIGAVEVAAPVAPTVSTSPAAQPTISVSILPATQVNAIHGTLHGKVNTNGQAVSWQFEYGKTKSYGKKTGLQKIAAGQGVVSVSVPVKQLSPNTVYHFRLVAVTASQEAISADATFKTASLNVRPSTVVAGHDVRLLGGAGTCRRGDRVTLISNAFSPVHKFGGKPAVYATVGAGARYSVITTIPGTRAPARYAVTARCGGGSLGVTAFLRVIIPPVPKFTG